MKLSEFLGLLQNVQGSGRQYNARCPAHEDRRASLSVGLGDDGRILLTCHAGCPPEAVADALGLSMRDLFDEQPHAAAPRVQTSRPVAVYDYLDASGKLLARKTRWPGKGFSWSHPSKNGGWDKGRGDAPKVLYNLPAVAAADTVWIVEGEKDADTLKSQGRAATCNPDGAGPNKWLPEFAEALRGKICIIIPDNDKQGREHAESVARSLHGVAISVKLINLAKVWPEIPEHGDVSDYLDYYLTTFGQTGAQTAMLALDVMVDGEPEYAPSKGESSATSGPTLIKASDVPYEAPRWVLAPYFQRGKANLIQGDNGTGKTAFMCAVAAHVSTGNPLLKFEIQDPGNVLILSVEDDLPVLRGRIEASGGNLDRCYFMSNAAGLTFNDPKVEQVIKELNARMVVFDPFQAFLGAGVDMHRSNETRPELAKLAEMAARNDCAVAIIAHMSKGGTGGAAVNRALGSVDIPAAMRSIIQLGRNPEDENEVVAIHVKCSNAPKGPGIAFAIGDRGGVAWKGYSALTVEDLETYKKRKETGIEYDHEPLVQVFRQLITDKPGGGFWSYADLKAQGAQILGFPPFEDLNDLRRKLDSHLGRELQKNDGIIVTHGEKIRGNVRGIRITRYAVPNNYQSEMNEY